MYDVLVVGSGPAGLAAAIYVKRANLGVAVIEREFMGTGQIAESGRVDNYPGYPGISGYELGEKFREHCEKLEVPFLEKEIRSVEQADAAGNRMFRLLCSDGEELEAKAVIYAAGASPRKAAIPGENAFLGKGVSYCALCDGAFYKGKRTAVLGGGDTALDDALYLADLCETVYLIHRRDDFRGAAVTLAQLEQRENVSILRSCQVEEILGDSTVREIRLKSGEGLSVDGVFVAFGSVPNTQGIQELAETDAAGYVIAGENGKTNCDGLFVAGDIRTKELRQVVTAVADGANAAVSAIAYVKRRTSYGI